MEPEFVILSVSITIISFLAGVLVSSYFFKKWQNDERYISKEEYDKQQKEKERETIEQKNDKAS